MLNQLPAHQVGISSKGQSGWKRNWLQRYMGGSLHGVGPVPAEAMETAPVVPERPVAQPPAKGALDKKKLA
jgi:hypothetical protein